MQVTNVLAVLVASLCSLTSAAPGFRATLCGGALTEYSEGGIFYRFNDPMPHAPQTCIWTVTPGKDGSFNGLKFTMISEEFTNRSFVQIAYPTADGDIVPLKSFEEGDLSSVNVPATVAFVIFSTEFYSFGKGFILYYEGINVQSTLEPIPNGERLSFDGPSGTYTTENTVSNEFSVYVFQNAPSLYEKVALTVKEFDIGVQNGRADKLDIWGAVRETSGTKNLVIQPIATVRGSSSKYNAPVVNITPHASQAIIAILRGGHSSSTKLTLDWQRVSY